MAIADKDTKEPNLQAEPDKHLATNVRAEMLKEMKKMPAKFTKIETKFKETLWKIKDIGGSGLKLAKPTCDLINEKIKSMKNVTKTVSDTTVFCHHDYYITSYYIILY